MPFYNPLLARNADTLAKASKSMTTPPEWDDYSQLQDNNISNVDCKLLHVKSQLNFPAHVRVMLANYIHALNYCKPCLTVN